ncbi:dTDP-glucose 4,6-dehydratase [Candidatus Poribacteria bacterium]|nr:dTDP-glucose 4,6-dehydratase [Candidatus Poribacteria bacterium]
MKILITGGAGFIGSNFIYYWLKNHPDDTLVNLDKLTYAGNLDNLRDVESHPKYQFVQGDICDGDLVNELMFSVDIVVHFAAESHVDRSITGPQIFVQTNVVGTQILLDAAARHQVKRFHHISTDEVYGSLELNSQEKFHEGRKYDPHSPYSASKAGADHLVLAYYHTYNLPVTISNCSNNFGPYQYPEKLIPLFVTNLLDNKKVPVYGDGLYVRDWLYVEDHCRAIDVILTKGQPGETYCVGGNAEISNIELTRKILKLMGKGEEFINYVPDRPGHDRRYAIATSKIENKLGWKTRHSFNEALRKTVTWYQENEWWWRKLRNKKEGEN